MLQLVRVTYSRKAAHCDALCCWTCDRIVTYRCSLPAPQFPGTIEHGPVLLKRFIGTIRLASKLERIDKWQKMWLPHMHPYTALYIVCFLDISYHPNTTPRLPQCVLKKWKILFFHLSAWQGEMSQSFTDRGSVRISVHDCSDMPIFQPRTMGWGLLRIVNACNCWWLVVLLKYNLKSSVVSVTSKIR